jgi:cardiolipin synthase C
MHPIGWLVIVMVVAWQGACTTIDRNVPRTPSSVLRDGEIEATALGQAWAAAASPQDETQSAFRLLPNNLEAFAARVAMVDAAERTLDLQYYIFRPDDTGLYLVDRMVAAADRGVRVRILIDDMCAHGIEKRLLAFDAHPNIELRLFNPWKNRTGSFGRAFEFLFNSHLNHRMHNKLFIADGIIAILGGRNLADEYFSLNEKYDFRDLDVAVAGPVVRRGNELFDDFWNGPDAIPVEGLKTKRTADTTLEDGRRQLGLHRERLNESPYAHAVLASEFVQELKSKSIAWIFAEGRIVGDSAQKFTSAAPSDPDGKKTLADEAKDVFLSSKKDMLICSPYFVPGKQLTQELCDLAISGVRVRILTNSQSSTDVPFVHAGYSKYRKKLLKAGVEMHELRVAAAESTSKPGYGSAVSSLHAKTFANDEQRAFIGSLNLDARSVVLNTEIGVVVESPELAKQLSAKISELMGPQWSYRVTLLPSGGGKLDWMCVDAEGKEIDYDTEPETSWWERFKSDVGGLLPIESQI